MEPTRSRYIRLNGLPEVLRRQNGSPRVIDATIKPAPRQSQYLRRQPSPTNLHIQQNHMPAPRRTASMSPNYHHLTTVSAAAQTSMTSSSMRIPTMSPHLLHSEPQPTLNGRSPPKIPQIPQTVHRRSSVTPVDCAPSPGCSEQCLLYQSKLASEINQMKLMLAQLLEGNSQPTRHPPTTARATPTFQPNIPPQQRTVSPAFQPVFQQFPTRQHQVRSHYIFDNVAPEPPDDLEMSFASQEYICRHKLNTP